MSNPPADKRYLVYLASNASGLDVERYEVQRLMARHGMVNVGLACREDAGPYDWNLVHSQIESADLFILLLGDDYGPMAPTGISFLHREFVHAKSLNKPTLAFIKNSLPEKNHTEAQRRLLGLHRIVAQQSPYKLWHLREELLSQVRAALSSNLLTIGPGWIPAQCSVAPPPAVAVPAATEEPMTPRQRQSRSRQMLNLQVTAKVYQGGNLSLEEVLLPARLDKLLNPLQGLLQKGASEDRLRSQLEGLISPTVRTQLLERKPNAHAVDDIRISRTQFQQMLQNWKVLGLIRSNGEAGRAVWQATGNVIE
ncbi:DUF4062 domain-containing protein [Oceanospirillaceae bacterium ASx5O]|nr:DUF4062 domain-containing protein [Oceanospirillaceae bacterium ASx5O]